MYTSLYKLSIVLALFSSLPALAETPVTQPLPESNPPHAAAMGAQKKKPGTDTNLSVLKRFQSHSGPRTPAALNALFNRPLPINISQQPEIAMSDGSTSITVEATFTTPNNTIPNFACNGAQLISVKRNDTGAWIIVILPDKNSWNTSLVVLTSSVSLEIPLTVAPLLPVGTDLSKQGFITFLGSNKGPDPQPQQDLNNDGLHDYLDDYIYTANYLVKQRSVVSAPESSSKTDGKTPLTRDVPKETPGSGPGISPDSSSAIKPETGTGRRDPANRNERARKMQEIIKRPIQ